MKKFSEQPLNEDVNKVYKPVLTEEDKISYVDQADMIKFIEANSNMKWNDICDYVRDVGIFNEDDEKTMWVKSNLYDKYYTDNKQEVVNGF